MSTPGCPRCASERWARRLNWVSTALLLVVFADSIGSRMLHMWRGEPYRRNPLVMGYPVFFFVGFVALVVWDRARRFSRDAATPRRPPTEPGAYDREGPPAECPRHPYEGSPGRTPRVKTPGKARS